MLNCKKKRIFNQFCICLCVSVSFMWTAVKYIDLLQPSSTQAQIIAIGDFFIFSFQVKLFEDHSPKINSYVKQMGFNKYTMLDLLLKAKQNKINLK